MSTEANNFINGAIPTLEEIRAFVESNRRAEQDAQRAKQEAALAEREAVTRQQRQDGEILAALASYFDASPGFVCAAIESRIPSLPFAEQPIFGALLAASRGPVNRFAIAEALHCLAGSTLPALHADDKLLGPSQAKTLREIPTFKPRAYDKSPLAMTPVSDWFEGWCTSVGIAVPEHPHIDFETEDQWNARITADYKRGLYGTTANVANPLVARERELLSKRRRELDGAANLEHHDALEDLRARILAVVDPVIAELDFGAEWWHAREVRRVIAREPTRMPAPLNHGDPFHAWRLSQMLGVRFPFNKLK